jgi:hypothetical protein
MRLTISQISRAGITLLCLLFSACRPSPTLSPAETPAPESPYPGYLLLSPSAVPSTYLIDNDGQVVHQWDMPSTALNQSVYLEENGNLVQVTVIPGTLNTRTDIYAWEGDLIWSFALVDGERFLHHDVEVLPSGNILMIFWEIHTAEEARAAGRDPALRPGEPYLWSDGVIEVDRETREIVWEWRAWDHLVQDFDPAAANYGVVADHPQRIDLNIGEASQPGVWNHSNAVDYHPERDEILLSVRNLSEIWMIDHNTTSAEAAGPGGDLLYRWGNPANYDAGDAGDRTLWFQHDARWITPGLPGAGNILIFNNGEPGVREFSTVMEISPPLDGAGRYSLPRGEPALPLIPVWEYTAVPPESFFAPIISGAQRLPDGHTLIDEGTSGHIFEVTADGQIIWEYTVPFQGEIWVQPFGRFDVRLTFRAERYPLDYPAFAGRDLRPGGVIPPVDFGTPTPEVEG